MKRFTHNLAKIMLAAALAAGLMPAAALADQSGAGVSESTSRFESTDGRNAKASTNVDVMVVPSGVRIIGKSPTPEAEDLALPGASIWVRADGGEAPYTAKWFRQKLGADGKPGATEALRTTSSDGDNVLELALTLTDLDADSTYIYWAEVTDSTGNPAPVDDACRITVTSQSRYTSDKVMESEDGRHEISGGGAGGGSIRDEASISSTPVRAPEHPYPELEDGAAAEEPPRAIAGDDGEEGSEPWGNEGWHVTIGGDVPDDRDAFKGIINGNIDVTDIVEKLVEEGRFSTPAEALGALGLIWHNPYWPEVGEEVVSVDDESTFGEPYRMRPEGPDANGRYYLTYLVPDTICGPSGDLGTFAVTVPAPQMYAITAEAQGPGQIDPAGTIERARGKRASFMLFPDVQTGSVIESVTVVAFDADGKAISSTPVYPGDDNAAGALSGNVFRMGRAGAEADAVSYTITAVFAGAPDPGPERSYALTLAPDDTPRDAQGTRTSVTLEGAEGGTVNGGSSRTFEVANTQPISLSFTTADGFAPDVVRLDYADPALKDADFAVAFDYLDLPALAGDARITVSYKKASPAPIGQSHPVEALVADAAQGSASANGSSAVHGSAHTFTATPAKGFEVAGAKVFYGAVSGSSVAWASEPAAEYDASKLSGAAGASARSLTLRPILAPTRVVFSFSAKSTTVRIPGEVDNAVIEVEGAPKVPGTEDEYQVTHGQPAKVIVTPDEGYELVAPGGLELVDADGNPIRGIEFKEEPAGSGIYVAEIPYEYLEQFGDGGATIKVTPTRKPIEVRPEPEQPGSVEVGHPDVDVPIDIRPGGPNQVIDEVIVDDNVILDKDAGELKDKLTETDADGNKWHPDYPGIKYDPDGGPDGKGEYIIGEPPDESRFVFDKDSGTITFTKIPDGKNHTVAGTAVPGTNLDVHVHISTEEGAVAGGTVVPEGQIPWKDGRDLTIVALPDAGYELEALFVGNDEVDVVDATPEHIASAKRAHAQALVWKGMLCDVAKACMAGASLASQQTADVRSIGSIFGIEQAYAESAEVPLGAKAHVIPGSRFDISTGVTYIEVTPVFRKIGSAAAESHTVSASVQGGHGTIEGGAGDRTVAHGTDCTLTFVPDVGWTVGYVTIDGNRIATTDRAVSLKDVQADHTVIVEFVRAGVAGDNSAGARAIRTLQALAQTGDLSAPSLMALMTLAFAAAGFAVITWSRGRREEEQGGGCHVA